jgi:hypothetical protein
MVRWDERRLEKKPAMMRFEWRLEINIQVKPGIPYAYLY